MLRREVVAGRAEEVAAGLLLAGDVLAAGAAGEPRARAVGSTVLVGRAQDADDVFRPSLPVDHLGKLPVDH